MKTMFSALAITALLAGTAIADDDRLYPTTMKELEQQQAEEREEFRKWKPFNDMLLLEADRLERINAKKAEEAARKKKSWLNWW